MAGAYSMDLTKGSVTKQLIRFALPILFSGVLQHLYTIADRIVVGNFAQNGTVALAAVGATGSATNLLLSLFNGISVGVNVLCSNLRGARNTKDLRKCMHTSLLVSVLLGLVMGAAGYLLSGTILTMMSTPRQIMDSAVLYMQIYFLGVPASLVYNFGAAILRSHGDTKRPMFILGITGLVNVGLNLVFVLGMGMDVAGVAIATIVAQYLSAIAVVWILFDPKQEYALTRKELIPHPEQIRKILAIGLPCGLNGMLFNIANVILQSSVNSFDSADIIAGGTAATDINNFFYLVISAFSTACVSFSGQCCGAKQYKRLDQLAVSAVLGSGSILLVLSVITTLFPRQLLGIFNSDPAVVEAGIFKLLVLSWATLVYTLGDCMVGCVRGMGKSVMPMLLNILAICGTRLIWVWVVFPFCREIWFLYLCYPVSWTCCAAVQTLYFFRCRKNLYAKEALQA